MEAHFPSPITCPVLIGREQELTTLRLLVARVQNGQGQVALVSGEAGVGKSRLIAEVKDSTHGFLLLEGQCFQTDSAFPYAPLLDLFRSYFARLMHAVPATLPGTMHSFAATVSRLLPELALQFPELTTLPGQQAVEPEEEKRRLFAAITHFLTEQAAQQPVLLVVEDIHWCDDLSLDLLLHLARRCRQVPLLLLVTYRSDENNPRLRQWLIHLSQERLAQECVLERFSRNDVSSMLHSMLDLRQEPDTDLLDTLYTQSEGNPFFLEELLTSLITAGEVVCVDGAWKQITRHISVPRGLQEALQQRTTFLSADAKRLLTLAAVAGRRFNVTLLQEVMQCDEAHLLSLLKEVVSAHLVIEEAADQFAFRHALTQEAIMALLLLRERQGLHRSLAETLARLSASSLIFREKYLEDLAFHCYEAGMWEQALAYSQELGEKALALYAQQAAVEHLTRAVNAAHYLSQTPSAHLYLLRGQAYEKSGAFERARGDYERALDAARTVADRLMEWQSMTALGFLWTGHDYKQAGVWFQQALAFAEQLADQILHAHTLNRFGNWLQNTGRFQEALEAHEKALHLFELQADRQGMAQTLEMLGMSHYFSGDPARAVNDFFGPAIKLFRSLGDSQSLFSILAARATDSAPETIESTFSALRTRDECLQDAEEALLLARQTNSLSGQAFVEISNTYALSSFGEFGPALSHAQEALSIATNIEHQEWIAASNGAFGQVYLLLLQPDKAISSLETGLAGARAIDSAIWIGYLTPYLALAYIFKQEFTLAEAALKTILPRAQQPGNFFERQAARVWGELALAQRMPAVALHSAEQLLISAPGDMQQPIPHLLALKGEALLALKRLEEAAEALENAKLGAEQRQAPSILWRIHRSLGKVYHVLKREEQAQGEWSMADDIISRLAQTIDETALREHFSRTALASLPQWKPLSPKALASSKYGGLSAREREVAALVARGKSNRAIAASLVVSERTAEAHVSNILVKLGLSTRAQIAAWAVENGLTTTHLPTT